MATPHLNYQNEYILGYIVTGAVVSSCMKKKVIPLLLEKKYINLVNIFHIVSRYLKLDKSLKKIKIPLAICFGPWLQLRRHGYIQRWMFTKDLLIPKVYRWFQVFHPCASVAFTVSSVLLLWLLNEYWTKRTITTTVILYSVCSAVHGHDMLFCALSFSSSEMNNRDRSGWCWQTHSPREQDV